jgi:hypothetical protein
MFVHCNCKLPILTVVPRKKEIPNLNIGENMMYIYETKGIKLNKFIFINVVYIS